MNSAEDKLLTFGDKNVIHRMMLNLDGLKSKVMVLPSIGFFSGLMTVDSLQHGFICRGNKCDDCPMLFDEKEELFCRCCHILYAKELKHKLVYALQNDDGFNIICYIDLLKDKIVRDYMMGKERYEGR